MAQVETYSNYPFNGNSYNVFVVKIDVESVNKFNIVRNDSVLPHQMFLGNLKNIDPSFFLINACISDTMCNPIGYYVKNNQLLQPVNLNTGNGNFYLKPNGALLFTQNDVYLCESSQIANFKDIRLGIQSGPLLLKDGLVNAQFNQNSSNKNIRCGVGLFTNAKGDRFLVYGISNNPISFYDFANFFKIKFKCYDALNLESAGCSMYFPSQIISNEIFNGYICNYLYI